MGKNETPRALSRGRRYARHFARSAAALLCIFWSLRPSRSIAAEAQFFIQAFPAAYYTTVAPISDVSGLGPDDYARYYAFPSVLNLGLRLAAARSELVFRIDIRPDFYSFVTENYFTNLPFIGRGITSIGDANMPTVGYFNYSGERLSLSVGRRQLAWGPGSYGLAIADGAPYMDHILTEYRFPTRRGDFWYEFVAIGADRPGNVFAQLDPAPSGYGFKNIFAHKLGWESDNLRFSVGELNLVHDIVPTLVDISPFAVYHNLYEDSYSNVMLQASGEGRLGDARAYGEFVMDDLVMPWEEANGSPLRPTAIGYMGGAEWKLGGGRPMGLGRMRERDYALRERTFSEAGGLRLRFEHYRTSTYLYNREIDAGKWTLPDHRLVDTSDGYLYTADAFFLGFHYGPDVRLDMLSLLWESASSKAALSLKYLSKGSADIESEYPPSNGASTWFALQEPVTNNFILGASVEVALYRGLGLWASGELWIGDTPGATVAAGLEYKFSTR